MVKLKENNLIYYYMKCTWNEKLCGMFMDLGEATRVVRQQRGIII